MRTEVKLQRGFRESVFIVDLPHIPEGTVMFVPGADNCRVILVYVDICPADGPTQVLCVQ